ncbi:MAG: glycerate kinase [Syntrophorhabdaceae bacterium]|nr:glycerate kinase [Syntrophorhabdaceae bacterium]
MEAKGRVFLKEIFQAGLAAVDPKACLFSIEDRIKSILDDRRYDNFLVIAFGKGAHPMTEALLEINNNYREIRGVVITKYGHLKNSPCPPHFSLFEAGHPVPDERGLYATSKALELIKKVGKNTFVFFLISGGGSSLFVYPKEPITLEDKSKTTHLLLRAGADIFELNCVRKHISAVKGGRLAELVWPAPSISLILSDVIGDPLDVIASGPTSPDSTTYREAMAVIEKYRLKNTLPESVISHIKMGVEGLFPETPKAHHPAFTNTEHVVIGNLKKAMEASARKAEELGFTVFLGSDRINGEAKEVGSALARKSVAMKIEKPEGKKLCFLQGGETTVTVKGKGIGGRNMELALAYAAEIKDPKGLSMLSAGTDGTDGPTDGAGAIVDEETMEEMGRLGLDPSVFLSENDSYTFFNKTKSLFITGPTGTNVMDMQIVLIF